MVMASDVFSVQVSFVIFLQDQFRRAKSHIFRAEPKIIYFSHFPSNIVLRCPQHLLGLLLGHARFHQSMECLIQTRFQCLLLLLGF